MVCTTLSVVHYCIYVCMFNLYATHLWAGTGLGLVYIPQIVYSIYVVMYSHLCKKMYLQFEIKLLLLLPSAD